MGVKSQEAFSAERGWVAWTRRYPSLAILKGRIFVDGCMTFNFHRCLKAMLMSLIF